MYGGDTVIEIGHQYILTQRGLVISEIHPHTPPPSNLACPGLWKYDYNTIGGFMKYITLLLLLPVFASSAPNPHNSHTFSQDYLVNLKVKEQITFEIPEEQRDVVDILCDMREGRRPTMPLDSKLPRESIAPALLFGGLLLVLLYNR
jgi:hypothetical protein